MSDEQLNLDSGVLIIGVTSTVLFEGATATELVLLNLSTGHDFTLPVSEEQAEHVLAQVGFCAEPSEQPQPEPSGITTQPARNYNRPVTTHDAWTESETTPQL